MKRTAIVMGLLLSLLTGSRVSAQEQEHITFIFEGKIEPKTPDGRLLTGEMASDKVETLLPPNPDYAGLRLAVDEIMQTNKSLFLPSAEPLNRRLSTLLSNPHVQRSLLLCRKWITASVSRPPSSIPTEGYAYLFNTEEDHYLSALLMSFDAQVYEALAHGDTENALTTAENLLDTLLFLNRNHLYNGDPETHFKNMLSLFALHLPQFSSRQLDRLRWLTNFVDATWRELDQMLETKFVSANREFAPLSPDLQVMIHNYHVQFNMTELPPSAHFTRTLFTSIETKEEINRRIARVPELLSKVEVEERKRLRDPMQFYRQQWGKAEKPAPDEKETQSDVLSFTFEEGIFLRYSSEFHNILGFAYEVLVPEKLDAQLFTVHLAIEQFRREHDRLPSDLFELNLGETTIDLLSGKRLDYVRSEDGENYTLTCNGLDFGHDQYTHQFVPGNPINLLTLALPDYVVQEFLPPMPEPEPAPDVTPDPDPTTEENP